MSTTGLTTLFNTTTGEAYIARAEPDSSRTQHEVLKDYALKHLGASSSDTYVGGSVKSDGSWEYNSSSMNNKELTGSRDASGQASGLHAKVTASFDLTELTPKELTEESRKK